MQSEWSKLGYQVSITSWGDDERVAVVMLQSGRKPEDDKQK